MRARFPLTWKILLVAGLNVAVLAAIAAVFVRYELGQEFTSMLLGPGGDRTVAIARQLALDLNDSPASDRDGVLERYGRAHGATFLLFDNDGTKIAGTDVAVPAEVVARITNRGRGGPPPDFPPGARGLPPPGPGRPPVVLPPTPPFLVTTDGPLKYWTGVRIPIRARDRDETIRGTALIASGTLLSNPMYLQPLPWIAAIGVTLAVTALCWIPFVRGVTRSIAAMTTATAEIAAGRFGAAPTVRRRDELGVLASAIAAMADRLRALVTGQRQFLRDAAHELRSPLGRLSLAVGLLQRDADEAVQRRAADVRDDIDLMRRLTDDLLVYARAESAVDALHLVPTDVRDAVSRAVRAEAGSADVRVDVDSDLHARANPDLLTRAIANLVRNAVAYAGGAGAIEVRGRRADDRVRLSVSDRGPGVSDTDLGRLFLPFYRPEASRDRRSGGTGLGLAIVRSAVEACGGSVVCRNLTPGFEVTIELADSRQSSRDAV